MKTFSISISQTVSVSIMVRFKYYCILQKFCGDIGNQSTLNRIKWGLELRDCLGIEITIRKCVVDKLMIKVIFGDERKNSNMNTHVEIMRIILLRYFQNVFFSLIVINWITVSSEGFIGRICLYLMDVIKMYFKRIHVHMQNRGKYNSKGKTLTLSIM